MRWKEYRDGIDVYAPVSPDTNRDAKPECVGKSSRAGAIAIGQTAASRVLTNMSAFIPS